MGLEVQELSRKVDWRVLVPFIGLFIAYGWFLDLLRAVGSMVYFVRDFVVVVVLIFPPQ